MPFASVEQKRQYYKEYYLKNKEAKKLKQMCPHNKYKTICRECGGSGMCMHNKRKTRCIECGGSAMCDHNKQKLSCRECSILVCLARLQGRRLYNLLKHPNKTKANPSIEYLDCTPDDFKKYIQSKFTDGMTFANISLDHIKPVSKFNLDDPDEFLKCAHYSNYQPLTATHNATKANKWSDADEAFWNENIIYKEYIPLYIPK